MALDVPSEHNIGRKMIASLFYVPSGTLYVGIFLYRVPDGTLLMWDIRFSTKYLIPNRICYIVPTEFTIEPNLANGIFRIALQVRKEGGGCRHCELSK